MNFSIRFARSNMSSLLNGNSTNDMLDRWDNRQGTFYLLNGEVVKCKEQTAEGNILISNYRIILQHNDTAYNIPLGVIDQVEARKISFLHILCKDARSYKCTFASSELCLEWQRKIDECLCLPFEIDKVFAVSYYRKLSIENVELHSIFTSHMNGLSYAVRVNRMFDDEVKRLGFDMEGSWRLSKANEEYRLCPSYPQKIIVPSSISDNNLEGVARFRSSRRIPAVVWRHPNGAIIARSSQPEVGWLGWRSSEDEDLLKAFAEACAYDSPLSTNSKLDMNQVGKLAQNIMDNSELWLDNPDGKRNNSASSDDTPSICDLPEAKSQNDIKKLLVVDARSYATAVANRARGGGCECPDYYPTCEIQFMNLDNIHGIRKSQHALRHLVSLPPDIPNWLSLLENSRWLAHVALLLKSAVTIAQTVALEARPVLVHCSDGWDRTPQLTALAQLLMDPFYRTIEGFQILIEREWIEFGHKFSDRCGCGLSTEDSNERSPIFLQWLDCIYQLIRQFPTAFQFNEAYLVKLSQHLYSNLFGTFLFNSSMKRNHVDQMTNFYSVWPLFKLHQQQYINLLFSHTSQVLYPSCHAKDMELWKAVYTNKIEKNLEECDANSQEPYSQEEEDDELVPPKRELVKTKSCNNLAECELGPTMGGRRSSDSNVRDSLPDMVMLKSALGAEVLEDNLNQSDCDDLYNSVNYSSAEKTTTIKDSNDSKSLSSHTRHITTTDVQAKMNGHTSTVVNGYDTVMFNNRSNLELSKIEGSTDTLVSESGHIDSGGSNGIGDIATTTVTAGGFNKKPPVAIAATYVSSDVVDSSSSTRRKISPREIENLCFKSKKLNLITNGGCDDKSHDEAKLLCSSIAECTFCFQSRSKMCSESWKSSMGIPTEACMNGIQRQNSKGTRYNTPGHSRSPSSGLGSTPSTDRASLSEKFSSSCQTVDGLSNFTDEVSRRLEQINFTHHIEIDNLKRELQATKSFYVQLIQNKLSHHSHENHSEDQVSLPESVGSSGSAGQESGLSDVSWENVEEGECNTTLWVPDHAVDHCMGCHSMFWLGRRKHHCRSCGNIFCNHCSENCAPIPKENLHEPVRVCGSCFSNLVDFKARPIPVASN